MTYNHINAAALGLALSAIVLPATLSAQTVFDNANRAEDQVESLFTAIEDDAARTLAAFGNEGRTQGFDGSVALRGIATSGTTQNVDLGVGADLDYVDGSDGYALAISYAYGANAGVTNEQSLIYGVEYTRDINSGVFAYGKLQGSVDAFSTVASDTFVGFGAGYRIHNDQKTQWSLQAGPGYRFTDLAAVAAVDVQEAAFSLSSDYATVLSNSVTLTNDTDLIWSASDTALFNDLALSVAMSDALALRTSVATEYHSTPGGGAATTDNTFGVSLVYSLN